MTVPSLTVPIAKTADDTSHPPLASPSIDHGPSATFTTLTRLLGASPSLSPEASRSSSYIHAQQADQSPGSRTKVASLSNHLLTRGLLQGRYSDITVHAFGTEYKLHRLVLDRAPFFATALSGPWIEAESNEITIHPEEIDSNITQNGFELALQRLYRGVPDVVKEDEHCVETFATGCWLEMPDLIESSVESVLRGLTPANLGHTIRLVTRNYYGSYGERILASAKAMLCRDGWKMNIAYWDSVPAETVCEVVGSDGLFVHGEWERFELATRILNSRLQAKAINMSPKSCRRAIRSDNVAALQESSPELAAAYLDPEVLPLLSLLDRGIHYMHLSFEQLLDIRYAKDVLGIPLVPEAIVANALWQQTELRHQVLNVFSTHQELGFTSHTYASEMSKAEPSNDDGTQTKAQQYWIPAADGNSVMGGNINDDAPAFFTTDLQIKECAWWQARQARIRAALERDKMGPPAYYSSLPPFRFSAEFPSPKVLKERKRIYSPTFFYAGSFWNIYIQKVASARSTKQLGVYLHRVRDEEIEALLAARGNPTQGVVESRIGRLEQAMTRRMQTQQQQPDAHRNGLHRSDNSDDSTSESDVTITVSDHDLPTKGGDAVISPGKSKRNKSAVSTLPPYVDVRPEITTYFKIFSPSRGGRMLSVYESAPDTFKLSQSWGWRSSTLLLDEGLTSLDENVQFDDIAAGGDAYESGELVEGLSHLNINGVKEEADPRKTAKSLGDGKLRFMVVIGVL